MINEIVIGIFLPVFVAVILVEIITYRFKVKQIKQFREVERKMGEISDRFQKAANDAILSITNLLEKWVNERENR